MPGTRVSGMGLLSCLSRSCRVIKIQRQIQDETRRSIGMSYVDLHKKTILVTGAAGFIGSNLVKRLYDNVRDVTVIGIDNMNDYYDVRLKEARLSELSVHPSFIFIKGSIADKQLVVKVFDQYKPRIVVNLAAQAGIRYSIINPDAYIESNLIGFYNILEVCRHG